MKILQNVILQICRSMQSSIFNLQFTLNSNIWAFHWYSKPFACQAETCAAE